MKTGIKHTAETAETRRTPLPPQPGVTRVDPVHALQRNLGNRALQRMMDPAPQCTGCLTQEQEEEEPPRAKSQSPHFSGDSGNTSSRPPALRGSGQPLEQSTREFFEPRFNQNFKDVRVHKDADAAGAAKSVNAKAYTSGKDVVFGAGQYLPGTPTGKKLLAHELTHVIQQDSQINRGAVDLQRMPDVSFRVHSLNARGGGLTDPLFDRDPELIDFGVGFGGVSPLEAQADVEVRGTPKDPCHAHEVGFLQTVYSHRLTFSYRNQARTSALVVPFHVPLPIRDGEERGSMWYSEISHADPAGCNVHVRPRLDDNPLLNSIRKVRTDASNQPCFLTEINREISFATILAESGPTGVNPLRHFNWSYHMSIRFEPNFANPEAAWPFNWIRNIGVPEAHQPGGGTVPFFTDAGTSFNRAITEGTPVQLYLIPDAEAIRVTGTRRPPAAPEPAPPLLVPSPRDAALALTAGSLSQARGALRQWLDSNRDNVSTLQMSALIRRIRGELGERVTPLGNDGIRAAVRQWADEHRIVILEMFE